MVNVNDIKNGMTILFEGNIYTVMEFSHVKPGKGAAFVQAKLKNLRTGSIIEKRFNSGVKLEKAIIEKDNGNTIWINLKCENGIDTAVLTKNENGEWEWQQD